MLIEFSISNFRSIADTQTFSFVADDSKPENPSAVFSPVGSVSISKFKLLKSAAVYGANAAGKSNVIRALSTMKRIVMISAASKQVGDELPVSAFKLDRDLSEQPSEFEVSFIYEGVRYQYGFSASRVRVHEEWLFAYPKGRPQNWFSRVWNANERKTEWSFSANLQGEKQTWKNATRDNSLFLSTAVQLNSLQLKPVFDWFKHQVRFIGVDGFSPAFSANLCHQAGHDAVLSFLKKGDVGIDGLDILADKFKPEALPDEMSEALKRVIIDNMQDEDVFEVKTKHLNDVGEAVVFDLEEESTGTQKLFAFAGPWLDCLEKGYTLFVDELHDNLHPKLVQYLVELFHNEKTNPNNAQLFFTTHETSILNQAVFRRDQVWFCEKDKRNATQLFPLTDFSPRKGRENLEAGYLSGRYGALPYIESLH